jgi:peroxiredoxin family protein
LVLFSGTDDKLNAAAVLTAGAAAMGRKVNIFLQYWALDAFRADRVLKDHGVAPEAGPEGAEAFERHGGQHWSEILRQAKEIGEVGIHACSLSMDMFARGRRLGRWSAQRGSRRSSCADGRDVHLKCGSVTTLHITRRSTLRMPCPGPLMSLIGAMRDRSATYRVPSSDAGRDGHPAAREAGRDLSRSSRGRCPFRRSEGASDARADRVLGGSVGGTSPTSTRLSGARHGSP